MRRVLILMVWMAGYFLYAQTPPNFTVTDLGILPSKAISQATAISSNGMVAGFSATAGFRFELLVDAGQGEVQGWIYSNGVQTPIQLSGPSLPLGINASGQVVGVTTPSDRHYLFAPLFYLNGNENTPDNLFIENVCATCRADLAAPFAINDSGAVVVDSNPYQIDLAFDTGPFLQGGVWANGSLSVLPLPGNCVPLKAAPGLTDNPNFCMSRAIGISGNGQYVAGFVWYPNQNDLFVPALWSNGQVRTFGSGGMIASINDSGQGAGIQAAHAMMFSPSGTAIDLGAQWAPTSINNNGWVVGSDQAYLIPHGAVAYLDIYPISSAISPGSANAILWANNTKYNLNTCSCINDAAGWEFDHAYGINDTNQIVGTGFHNGIQTGFLLTPEMPPAIAAVVNAASFAKGGVVPGEIATAFGTNLTSATGVNLASGLPLPSTFLTDSLIINDQAVALFAVDNSNGQQQINFQVPWNVASGPTATIAVSNKSGTSASISVPVLAAQPGIFSYLVGANSFGAILHTSYQLADTEHPGKPGETVLIYCTGLGAVSSPPADGEPGNGQPTNITPTVTIGGTKAIVSFSGLAPGFVGLYQINTEIPSTAKTGNQPVLIEMRDVFSNSVLLPVE